MFIEMPIYRPYSPIVDSNGYGVKFEILINVVYVFLKLFN